MPLQINLHLLGNMSLELKIGAIVLNYRQAAQTGECLRSLASQNIHLALVVDNSHDEQSASELKAVLEELQEQGLDFKTYIITPMRNLGFSGGVNLACNSYHAENCDAFLLVNNDAIAGKNMVHRLAEALNDEPLVVPLVLDFSHIPQPAFWYQRFFGLMTHRQTPGAFKFPSGCCLLFQKELLSQGLLLDEHFFMYGEDVLLGWQLSEKGFKNGPKLVMDAVVYHQGKSFPDNPTLFYEYHSARAHILLSLKTWHFRLEVPLLLIAKAIGIGSRAVYRALRYKSFTPLLGFLLAWLPLDIQPHGKRQH